MQLAVAAKAAAAAGADPVQWRSAWRRAAAAHVAGWAAGAAAACWLGSGELASRGSAGLLLLAKQLAWAAAAGLAAAEGPPAFLAAMQPGTGSGKQQAAGPGASPTDGGCRRQVQLCTLAAGLVAAVLQAAHLLLGQWVRCLVALLAAVPLYTLAAAQPPSGLARLAAAAAVLACGSAAGWGAAAGAPWLLPLLAPPVLLVTSALW